MPSPKRNYERANERPRDSSRERSEQRGQTGNRRNGGRGNRSRNGRGRRGWGGRNWSNNNRGNWSGSYNDRYNDWYDDRRGYSQNDDYYDEGYDDSYSNGNSFNSGSGYGDDYRVYRGRANTRQFNRGPRRGYRGGGRGRGRGRSNRNQRDENNERSSNHRNNQGNARNATRNDNDTPSKKRARDEENLPQEGRQLPADPTSQSNKKAKKDSVPRPKNAKFVDLSDEFKKIEAEKSPEKWDKYQDDGPLTSLEAVLHEDSQDKFEPDDLTPDETPLIMHEVKPTLEKKNPNTEYLTQSRKDLDKNPTSKSIIYEKLKLREPSSDLDDCWWRAMVDFREGLAASTRPLVMDLDHYPERWRSVEYAGHILLNATGKVLIDIFTKCNIRPADIRDAIVNDKQGRTTTMHGFRYTDETRNFTVKGIVFKTFRAFAIFVHFGGNAMAASEPLKYAYKLPFMATCWTQKEEDGEFVHECNLTHSGDFYDVVRKLVSRGWEFQRGKYLKLLTFHQNSSVLGVIPFKRIFDFAIKKMKFGRVDAGLERQRMGSNFTYQFVPISSEQRRVIGKGIIHPMLQTLTEAAEAVGFQCSLNPLYSIATDKLIQKLIKEQNKHADRCGPSMTASALEGFGGDKEKLAKAKMVTNAVSVACEMPKFQSAIDTTIGKCRRFVNLDTTVQDMKNNQEVHEVEIANLAEQQKSQHVNQTAFNIGILSQLGDIKTWVWENLSQAQREKYSKHSGVHDSNGVYKALEQAATYGSQESTMTKVARLGGCETDPNTIDRIEVNGKAHKIGSIFARDMGESRSQIQDSILGLLPDDKRRKRNPSNSQNEKQMMELSIHETFGHDIEMAGENTLLTGEMKSSSEQKKRNS
ncbi:Oidioi.mRNA.OKI2018_I69.chr1.g3840.t1.cds [Oikopleura dioica]|uniref:Oidioi.mRNA.OKI2018_I69.chr1.g3840.t1.cds n=1 Tax=Oikopleura dioica TaxID=34765 RepID=A0ABN7T4J7_OIKDI|nr:Oidioi.mRNA.OKI2018_I69.chr1.g3840.t1.cds [Oikopleura dioica]